MPRIRNIPGPYHIFFVSFDCAEPAHIHIVRENCEAKYWLQPIRLAYNRGYRQRELNRVARMIERYHQLLMEAWNEHCNPD